MSEIVGQVTGVNTGAAVEGAADDADKHTPPPPVTAPPASATGDASNSDKGLSELREMVTGLGSAVAALTETVNASLTKRDESPGKRVPWTHRGGRHAE